jgi:hypothetical protein
MLYRTGYDTTIGMGLVTKQIEHAVKESFIKDLIFNRHLDLITSQNYRPVFITGHDSSESNIPFFEHPLVIENYKGMNFICTDIRPCVRVNDTLTSNEVSVRNKAEFDFAVHRTILNMAWMNNEINQLKLNLNFAGTVFAAWLSETIAKRFALDARDQIITSIIAHFYYQSLFYSEDKFEEDMLQKFAVHTIKATKAPSQLVFEIFDQIGPMGNINDFCETMKTVTGNIRLESLNFALLITMVSNSWFSTNAANLLAVALEHPPTWIAIVQSSLTERGYRNSLIARIAERFGKGNNDKEFMANFVDLIKAYKEAESKETVFRAFE